MPKVTAYPGVPSVPMRPLTAEEGRSPHSHCPAIETEGR